MFVQLEYVYLFSLIPFLFIWLFLFFINKRTRKEMLLMSILIGLVSVASSYYWWTIDWWQPATITGTKVGIEDFIMGFTAGGIMVSIYEIIFRKKYIKRDRRKAPNFILILLFLSNTTAFLIWGIGVTTFWASFISLILSSLIIFYFRKDLIINGLWSGILMLLISLILYFTIMFISPDWISQTYIYEGLSGIHFLGIPIEELVFWFLAGVLWGPLYEFGFNLYEKN